MEDVGVFAVEAECVAEEILQAINDKTSIVTCSLGSGSGGDVIMSFVADICGEASEATVSATWVISWPSAKTVSGQSSSA